jgi:hypothetical protein
MFAGQHIEGRTYSPGPSPIADGLAGSHLHAHFESVLGLLARRELRGQTLSFDDVQRLREPVLARMRADLLAADDLYGFLTCVLQGGIPPRVLEEDPLLPLDRNLVGPLKLGAWLPPHLAERLSVPQTDFVIQQERVIRAIQSCMQQRNIEIPIFFLGSGAGRGGSLFSDIDIGASRYSRGMGMLEYDTLASLMRETLSADSSIVGNRKHVGAVFGHMVLSLGVSVAWHGRAFRVTPDEVFAIEASAA